MCSIDEIIISGENFTQEGSLTHLSVTVRAESCSAVDITVYSLQNPSVPILESTSTPLADTSPTLGPPMLGQHVFEPDPSLRLQCNESVRVVVTCSSESNCPPVEKTLSISCKGLNEPTPSDGVTTWCLIWRVGLSLALIAALVTLIFTSTTLLVVSLTGLLTILLAFVVAIFSVYYLIKLCSPSYCWIWSAICWSMKWGVTLGGLLAVANMSVFAMILVAFLGMGLAAVIWNLVKNGCVIPQMLALP